MKGRFNLSHRRMLTGDMGQFLPCGLVEVLPGDQFRHSASALVRLSPMAAPVMHQMNVRLHHFFVPHRLTWEKAGGTGTWEDFITSGPDGNDAQQVPRLTISRTVGDILDYLGAPPTSNVPISALPVVAYHLIFDEWYRDQDLVSAVTNWTENKIHNVAWEKDYLSSARPWEQKGPDITLPLGERAEVRTGAAISENVSVLTEDSGNTPYEMGADLSHVYRSGTVGQAGRELYADLSNATASTVNDLRRAMALQRYAEARARYGSRYAEYLRHLGVRPRDARLQRPEFLGGGTQTVAVSEVLQTAPEGSTPVREYGVGDLYGHGVAAMRSNRYRHMFHEHGYVISLMSVRPQAMYLHGVPRTWKRRTRDEFWQRELQHIGQQAVLNDEVFADATNGEQTFGYADRYRDYRECWSQVSAEFRDVLNYWHLARDFATAPALNQDFVTCTPSKRIFNEQTQHSMWVTVGHELLAKRLVSRDASAHIR